MAVRKQDFNDSDEQIAHTTKRSRITFDVSPQLRRRIKLAALQNDLSIGEYLGRILEQVVPEETRTAQRPGKPLTRKTVEHVLQVREQIKQHSKGYLFEDSTEMIRQMREERSRELEQL